MYKALARRRLRVSRATVFRTLESLARLGIIAKACHTGSSVRYDGRTDLHHHLICTACDRVIDLSDKHLDSRAGARHAPLRVRGVGPPGPAARDLPGMP